MTKSPVSSLRDPFTFAIFKKMFSVILPGCVCSGIADIADALVLGIRLGSDALAAIAFVTPVFMLYNVLGIGLATGGAIQYAKLLGSGQAKSGQAHFTEIALAELAMGILLLLSGAFCMPQILHLLGVQSGDGAVYQMTAEYGKILLLGAPLFFLHSLLFAFARSDGGERLTTLGFLIGSGVDLVLNILFVLHWDLGVRGAAFSTLAGVAVGIVIVSAHLFHRSSILRPCWQGVSLTRVAESFSVGLSTSLLDVWNLLSFLIINHLLMYLGGASAVGVFDLTLNLSYLVLSVFHASEETLRPMCATFLGEHNWPAVWKTLWFSLLASLVCAAVFIIPLGTLASPICSLLGIPADDAARFGVRAVRLYLLGSVAAGSNLVFSAWFQVIGRERVAFLVGLLRGFALYAPAAIICGQFFGLRGIWLMFPVTEFLTISVCLIFRQRAARDAGKDASPSALWLLDGTPASLSNMLEQAEEFTAQQGASMKESLRVRLALEEICSLIIRRGFSGDTDCRIQITLLAPEGGDFELHLRDNASRFDLFSLLQKDALSEDAMALSLILNTAKSHFYRHYEGFNTLTVTIGAAHHVDTADAIHAPAN